MQETIRTEDTGPVRTIVLARPEAGNALDVPMTRLLAATLAQAEADSRVRALVLAADGKLFCGGGDLRAMGEAFDTVAYVRELADALREVVLAMTTSRLPIVAAVHGPAAGAGLGLALAADLVLIGPRAKFLTAYVGVGLSADTGVSGLLPRIVGRRRAAELLLTGRTVNAAEAVEIGLANEALESDLELAARANQLASALAAAPPKAIAEAKRLLAEIDGFRVQLDAEVASVTHLASTVDTIALLEAVGKRSS